MKDRERETPLRVAVTRDEGPDGPLAEALRRRGLEPIPCPTISEMPPMDRGPLEQAAARLETYPWLVVSSVRAVDALMEARHGRRLPPGLRTAAVGRRTAEALLEHGATDPLTPVHAGAESLVPVLREADRWPGRRVLLPRAAEGRQELAEALESWGALVDEVVAYRTVAKPPGEIAAAWRSGAPQAVVVASPSAARALVAALGADALRSLEPLVAIGTTTAMELVALGVQAITPPRADFEAIAELLQCAPLRRGETPS